MEIELSTINKGEQGMSMAARVLENVNSFARCLSVAVLLGVTGATGSAWAGEVKSDEQVRQDFANPPLRWQSRPLWFWNGPLTTERTREQLEGRSRYESGHESARDHHGSRGLGGVDRDGACYDIGK